MKTGLDLTALLHELGPRFAATAAANDAGGRFVTDNYDVLRARRAFSALVPVELGGGGVDHGAMCAFIRALAHHCSATALALSMHQHLVAAAVFNHRNGKPGKALLERVAASECVLVSTGANDWLDSNGMAERVEGGFRVSARKPFASGAPKGDLLVTSAPWHDPRSGWQVLHFAVPFAAEGVSLADDWDAIGMRATGSHSVVLDKVMVPEAAVALRRPRGEYHPAWNVILTVAMPLIMSAYVGIAEAAAEKAINAARARPADPATPYLIGELTNALTTAQLALDGMVTIAGDLDFVADTATANAVLVRKSIASGAVLATVEKAMEVAGGAAFYREFGLERLLRDAHGVRYHPLPEKRQHHFTGRLALGLDPVAGVEPPVRDAAA